MMVVSLVTMATDSINFVMMSSNRIAECSLYFSTSSASYLEYKYFLQPLRTFIKAGALVQDCPYEDNMLTIGSLQFHASGSVCLHVVATFVMS
jgi:hypothetical protein